MHKFRLALWNVPIFCLAAVAHGQTCPNYSAAKVLAAARQYTSGITVVSAHRGSWEFVPENSTMSVQAAVNQCIEVSEIDVRLTSDGVPVLEHDLSLERTTTGDGWVNEVPYAQFANFFYLNRQGQQYAQLANQPGPVPANPNCGTACASWPAPVAVGQPVPVQSLFQFLSVMKTNPNLVIAIDPKGKSGYPGSQYIATTYQNLIVAWNTVKAWEAANGNYIIRNRIIWKVGLRDMPADPRQLDSDLGFCTASDYKSCPDPAPQNTSASTLFNVIPVWFSESDPVSTAARFCTYNIHLGATGTGTCGPYNMYATTTTGYLWNPELVLEYPGQSLESVLVQYTRGMQNIAAFLPASEFAEGMHQKTADCCRYRFMMPFPLDAPPDEAALANYTDPVSDQGPIAYSGDMQFLWSRSFNLITGDHVQDIVSFLQSVGQRNTSLISQ